MSKTIFLVDASLYIYRSFHAIPSLSNSAGRPTNAVYGFLASLHKLLREKKPDFLALAFDAKGPTFRQDIFPEYKANREEMPEDLIQQQEPIRRAVTALSLPVLEVPGIEADDIIASLAGRALEAGFEVVIVAKDKDYYQLLGDRVSMYDPNLRGDWFMSKSDFEEQYGFDPRLFLEVQGLMGDATDNYKGVPGVGEKTAVKLVKEFGTLENLYERLDDVPQAGLRQKLTEHQADAFLARDLARLKADADLEADPEALHVGSPDIEALRDLYRELEFSRFLEELDAEPMTAISREDYHLVDDEEKLQALAEELAEAGRLSVDLETTSVDAMRAEIVGMSLCARPHRAFYLPMGHGRGSGQKQADNLPFEGHETAFPQLGLERVLEVLGPLLTSPDVRKLGQNIKYDYIVLRRHGLEISPIGDDSMIASWLLNPSAGGHNLSAISRTYLNHDPIAYKDVVGDRKAGFETVSPAQARDYAAEDADLALILVDTLRPKLEEDGLLALYEDMELPLIKVLAEMEMNGVKLDTTKLSVLSQELGELAAASEERIYGMAGRKFNINSPKQLGQVLFEELKLPQGKKTKKKTGYSTDIEVLTQLAEVHPLPAEILAYRTRVKLRSTYVDALPQLIHPQTGRVHTSFNQAGTATGRLSSSDPNLQNIPIRTEEGLRIRDAFVPEPGGLILSADYSQIELRLLAHVSGDPGLLQAFTSGEDVHTRTAAEVFGVAPDQVSPLMRRNAKAINFGIIYGMQAFGLARQLGIERRVAQEYIDHYFERYSGVKAYIAATIEQARQNGYTTTLLGRRRRLPELGSKNNNLRSNAERMAINTPLQGTAADIIKRAMLRVSRAMKKARLQAKLILQVHDELVFEVPEKEAEKLSELVRVEMESALPLKIPLIVDIHMGASWAEAH